MFPTKRLFPLRHTLVYRWSFARAGDLAEVARNLNEEFFYVLKAKPGLLTVTSRSKPTAVIFVVIQRDRQGGELILIQTIEGCYTYSQLNHYIHIFGKKAGIKITSQLEETMPGV